VLLAEVLMAQGRNVEAWQIARVAVTAYEQAGTVPAGLGLAHSRRVLASTLVLQQHWRDALSAYEEMVAGIATDPESPRQLVQADAYWGLAYIKSGRPEVAVESLASRVTEDRRVLGDSHPEVVLTRGMLGLALARSGDAERALSEFGAVASALLDSDFATGERSAADTELLRHIVEGYLDLLISIRGTERERASGIDSTDRGFQLADLLRGQTTRYAVAAAAARAASGDPSIADLARREQDLGEQARAQYRYLFNQLSLAPSEQSPKVVADMRRRLEEIDTERRKLRSELRARSPRYEDLVNPRPPTLGQTRALLRDGEVLLSIVTTRERTFVWAVPKSGDVSLHSESLDEARIRDIVETLRRALEPREVELARIPEFDLTLAARLYDTLLRPIEGAWRNAGSLLVVSSGALGQLPFALLPAATVDKAESGGVRFERYKSVPWLVRQIAVTQLPSVNALVTLRNLPAGSARRSAFAGFGDPQFGAQQAAASAAGLVAMRNLGVPRVTEAGLRGGSAPGDYMPYGALPPLPDTREEIIAIARALKADLSRDVFLGAAASKQSLKSADLANRRIVAFATHGLVPGDFPNLDQPALALASPDGKAESGLLTLEEILQLKLDADWVVLSACNTAAGDGAGAEAISGLGRGFFYAGSRSLLVTHWPVETRSARVLVTKLFERYADEASLTRAQALRAAQLAIMDEHVAGADGKPVFSYAHPLFWGAYALVGDGGR